MGRTFRVTRGLVAAAAGGVLMTTGLIGSVSAQDPVTFRIGITQAPSATGLNPYLATASSDYYLISRHVRPAHRAVAEPRAGAGPGHLVGDPGRRQDMGVPSPAGCHLAGRHAVHGRGRPLPAPVHLRQPRPGLQGTPGTRRQRPHRLPTATGGPDGEADHPLSLFDPYLDLDRRLREHPHHVHRGARRPDADRPDLGAHREPDDQPPVPDPAQAHLGGHHVRGCLPDPAHAGAGDRHRTVPDRVVRSGAGRGPQRQQGLLGRRRPTSTGCCTRCSATARPRSTRSSTATWTSSTRSRRRSWIPCAAPRASPSTSPSPTTSWSSASTAGTRPRSVSPPRDAPTAPRVPPPAPWATPG